METDSVFLLTTACTMIQLRFASRLTGRRQTRKKIPKKYIYLYIRKRMNWTSQTQNLSILYVGFVSNKEYDNIFLNILWRAWSPVFTTLCWTTCQYHFYIYFIMMLNRQKCGKTTDQLFHRSCTTQSLLPMVLI